MLSRNGNILFRKLHSMRETPQKVRLPHFTEKTTRSLSPSVFFGGHDHVKMSWTRGQYAWFSSSENHKNADLTENHQRLNVEKHSQNWQQRWVVGLVDGDGTFTVDRQRKPNGTVVWNLVFKISLTQSNARSIYKVKRILGAGHVQLTPDSMMTLRIRDRAILKKHVFPVFDRIPLLSKTHYDYVKLRQIDQLLDATTLEKHIRDQHIEDLVNQKTSRNAIAPIWHHILSTQDLESFLETGHIILTKPQVDKIITLPWLSGFLEAKGSFYIVRKDTHRYCHAFGLSQQGNSLVMHGIRCFLKIVASVKLRTPKSFQKFSSQSQSFYSLETTNWRNVQFIKDLFSQKLLGIKSRDFRIWERSMKYRSQPDKLRAIQEKMRKVRRSTPCSHGVLFE